MLTSADLRKIALARLEDAKVLFSGNRYDGAAYLCGYVVELSLKSRICRALKWTGFPEKGKEFEGLQSFKTHDLNLLLHFTGREPMIRANYLPERSTVTKWAPEWRYSTVGTAIPGAVSLMIQAAELLRRKL